jgi:hypothetical protein
LIEANPGTAPEQAIRKDKEVREMSLPKNGEKRKSISFQEKEYFASGVWKCPKSETGSHRWDCNLNPPVCKICGKTKQQTQPEA